MTEDLTVGGMHFWSPIVLPLLCSPVLALSAGAPLAGATGSVEAPAAGRPRRRVVDRAPPTPLPVSPFLPTNPPVDAGFKAWPALNDEATRRAVNAGRRHRLHLQNGVDESGSGEVDPTLELFRGDSLMCRFALALAARKAIDRKEFFEACEFFARVRSRLRADDVAGAPCTLVDVAGGHGLVGTLACMFKYSQFDRVIVRDPRKPKAFDAVVEAATEVAPWVEGRITFEQMRVGPRDPLPRGCAVASVHGCGTLTDKVIAAAADADARSVALMPCCYPQTAAHAPSVLRRALGVALAADVHRTYELERLGYSVTWKAIPLAITPMNRVLLAHR